jgi:hypothetical protein
MVSWKEYLDSIKYMLKPSTIINLLNDLSFTKEAQDYLDAEGISLEWRVPLGIQLPFVGHEVPLIQLWI